MQTLTLYTFYGMAKRNQLQLPSTHMKIMFVVLLFGHLFKFECLIVKENIDFRIGVA